LSQASPAATAIERKPTRRLRAKILVLAVSTTLSLLLAEAILRIVAPPFLQGSGMIDAPKAELYGGAIPPHYRHRFRNPDTGEVFYATTNSQGWKDVEHSFTKPDGAVRILFLGDSFTWGYVPTEELYTRQVERLLRSRGCQTVEVVSIGLASWGTDHSLEALTREGLSYEPDIVIYQFCGNDVADNVVGKFKPFQYVLDENNSLKRVDVPWSLNAESGAIRSLVHKSALFDNLSSAWRQIGSRHVIDWREHIEQQRPDPTSRYFLYPASGEQETAEVKKAWQLWGAIVAEMNEISKKHNAEFLVFPASDCDAAYYRWLLKWKHIETDGMHDFITWEGKRYPADHNWPLKNLERICERTHITLIRPKRDYDRFECDAHTNTAGNSRMAEDIVDFLEGWEPFRRKIKETR
jgi:hypothetical protein